jgi:hypothetical protein
MGNQGECPLPAAKLMGVYRARSSYDHAVRTLGGPPSHYTRAVQIRAVPARCVEGQGAHPLHERMPDVWDTAVRIPSMG